MHQTLAPRLVAVHGPALLHLRTLAGLTVRELAVKADGAVSHAQISRIERGICKSRPEVVAALAAALGTTPPVLLANPHAHRDAA